MWFESRQSGKPNALPEHLISEIADSYVPDSQSIFTESAKSLTK
jgi:hypothetical protein